MVATYTKKNIFKKEFERSLASNSAWKVYIFYIMLNLVLLKGTYTNCKDVGLWYYVKLNNRHYSAQKNVKKYAVLEV